MSAVAFLLLNGIVVILIVAFFLRGRSQDPSRLFFKGKGPKDQPALPGRAAPPVAYSGPAPAKELTVFFEYAGSRFEAHEVLDLAAGSSLAAAERAYRELIAKSSADRHRADLLTAALVAIRKAQGR